MTGMVLQALTPYMDQPAVAAAVDKAVTALSTIQNSSGGYASWGTVNAESIAQVIVALTSLGIDPGTDARFVKADGNAVTALLDFFAPGGGFKHTLVGSVNGMATDQAAYALVAYDRFVNGKNRLYDMTDGFSAPPGPPAPETPAIVLDGPEQVSAATGTAFSVDVKATSFPVGSYKLLDGVIVIPQGLTVTGLTAGSRLGGGALTWNLDAQGLLRFVYTGGSLQNLQFSGQEFPADLLRLGLAVTADAGASAVIGVQSVTLKEASDKPALVFDIDYAAIEIGLNREPVSATVRELFTGDGVDLIPASKRAVAVAFTGVPEGVSVTYKGADLIYSPEMTAKHGVATYVLMTTPAEPSSDLVAVSNYAVGASQAATVRFGDTDVNQVINAQDAVDVISAWIRLTAVTGDQQILRMNVTSDPRIDTFDALGIMEQFVSNRELAIISR
jgi:hypothetical protein